MVPAHIASRATLVFAASKRLQKLFNTSRVRNGRYFSLKAVSHLKSKLFHKIDNPSPTYARYHWNGHTGNGRLYPTRLHCPVKETRAGFATWKKEKTKCKITVYELQKMKVWYSIWIKFRQSFENLTDTVTSIHFKKRKSKELLMDRHKSIKTFGLEILQTEWREQVRMPQPYGGYWRDVLKLLQVVEHVCDGFPVWIGLGRRRIELTSPDIQAVRSSSYRAGPNTQEIKKDWNQQDALNSRHRSRTTGLGFTYCVCPEERQISLILCPL